MRTPSWMSARADPGAEGRDDDEALLPLGGAVVELGDPRGVRVVDEDDVVAELLLEHRLGLEVEPRLVDVGGRADDALGDDTGDGDADGGVAADVVEVVDDLADDVADRLGRGLRRGVDPLALAGERTLGEVDRRALDAAPADVDAEGQAALLAHGGLLRPSLQGRCFQGRVRISLPVSVMRMVCSNWAERLRSAVTTVQSSSHISHASVPRLSMGSMVKVMPGSMTVS